MSDRTGTLTIDAEHATLTLIRRRPYTIETVWAAITDPVQRAAWFGETTIDGQVGGRIEMMPMQPPAPPKLPATCPAR